MKQYYEFDSKVWLNVLTKVAPKTDRLGENFEMSYDQTHELWNCEIRLGWMILLMNETKKNAIWARPKGRNNNKIFWIWL